MAQRQEVAASVAQARERINPQLNLQGLKSSDHDPSGDSVQASLLFPLDLHGTRSLKSQYAAADLSEKEASGQVETQQALIGFYLSLHRIRQMKVQSEILHNTLDSMVKLGEVYKKRPKLSPSQSAEREILQLAKEETSSRLTLIEQELHGLEHDIEIALGESWDSTPKNLPPSPERWPELTAQNPADDSPIFARWKAFQNKVGALAELTKAEKKSMIWLGPSAEWSKIDSQSGFRVGLSLQMPLPVLESHRATSDLADQMKNTAVIQAQTQLHEAKGEWLHNTEIYQGSTKALLALEPLSQNQKRVLNLHNLFRQGMISGATYVEGLRQSVSLQQNHDELESKALMSWCQLQFFQNHYEGCFL